MKYACLLGFVSLLSISCQRLYEAQRPYVVYPKPEAYYTASIINDEKQKVTLANVEYPIYLKIHRDKTFHYNLPRLGEGYGTWTYVEGEGFIHLHADRTLFVMDFEIRAMDQTNNKILALEFSDRFGPKYLPLEVIGQ